MTESTGLYTVAYRDKVREFVLEMARADARVVSGAQVGSLALGKGDRWSDLDLTFGVDHAFSHLDVLEDWTRIMVQEFSAVHLFDLPSGPSIYRVFLLPGCLQFDLSFTPVSEFGATGPRFKLLFGTAVVREMRPEPSTNDLFGYAAHHALRVRFCVERGRMWQAAYWLNHLRDYALSMACRKRGLPPTEARGYDDLPADVLEKFKGAIATSLDRAELMRALDVGIECLLSESGEVQELADQVAPELRKLVTATD